MCATKWKESLFSKEQMFLIELIKNEPTLRKLSFYELVAIECKKYGRSLQTVDFYFIGNVSACII